MTRSHGAQRHLFGAPEKTVSMQLADISWLISTLEGTDRYLEIYRE